MVRSMSINVDKKIMRGSFAYSKNRPLEYTKGETQFKKTKDKEKVLKKISEKEYFLSEILYNFSGGMFRLTSSVSVKYLYALSKVIGGVNEVNEEVFNITKVILEDRELTDKEANNIKKLSTLFELYLKEKDKEISEVVKLKNGNYLLKQTSKNLMTTTNKSLAKVFTSRKELFIFKNEYKEYIA